MLILYFVYNTLIGKTHIYEQQAWSGCATTYLVPNQHEFGGSTPIYVIFYENQIMTDKGFEPEPDWFWCNWRYWEAAYHEYEGVGQDDWKNALDNKERMNCGNRLNRRRISIGVTAWDLLASECGPNKCLNNWDRIGYLSMIIKGWYRLLWIKNIL